MIVLSEMSLPSRKALWFGLMIYARMGFSLLAITFGTIFRMTLQREIGLKSLGY